MVVLFLGSIQWTPRVRFVDISACRFPDVEKIKANLKDTHAQEMQRSIYGLTHRSNEAVTVGHRWRAFFPKNQDK